MTKIRGEAPDALTKDTELSAANHTPDDPVLEHLTEEVCKGENVKKAYQRVKSNKGSPGIDGMTVLELGRYLRGDWVAMKERLPKGTYQPQPVKRVAKPKPDGSSRTLGIPTVVSLGRHSCKYYRKCGIRNFLHTVMDSDRNVQHIRQ